MCVKSILPSLTDFFFSKKKKNSAFTLTEIMIVIMIMSLTAAFAMPDHTRGKRKAYEKSMTAQLELLGSANQMYRARNGTYLPTGAGNMAAVNSGLNLNLISPSSTVDSFTYAGNATTFTATMTYEGRTVRIDQSSSEPCCDTDNCLITTISNCP